MFLNEVALGKPKEIVRDDRTLKQAPAGFDSVVARGQREPSEGTIMQHVTLHKPPPHAPVQQLPVSMCVSVLLMRVHNSHPYIRMHRRSYWWTSASATIYLFIVNLYVLHGTFAYSCVQNCIQIRGAAIVSTDTWTRCRRLEVPLSLQRTHADEH